jgi:DICT domain-containing protein
MTTLTEIQADRISDEVRRFIISEWFANEWQLVTMNDNDTYQQLMNDAEGASVASLSDKLREDWERLAEQVGELVAEKISETASLYIKQFLQGWGSLPFDIIAREAIKTYEETK